VAVLVTRREWIAFSAAGRAGSEAVFVVHPDGSMLREVGTARGGLYKRPGHPTDDGSSPHTTS